MSLIPVTNTREIALNNSYNDTYDNTSKGLIYKISPMDYTKELFHTVIDYAHPRNVPIFLTATYTGKWVAKKFAIVLANKIDQRTPGFFSELAGEMGLGSLGSGLAWGIGFIGAPDLADNITSITAPQAGFAAFIATSLTLNFLGYVFFNIQKRITDTPHLIDVPAENLSKEFLESQRTLKQLPSPTATQMIQDDDEDEMPISPEENDTSTMESLNLLDETSSSESCILNNLTAPFKHTKNFFVDIFKGIGHVFGLKKEEKKPLPKILPTSKLSLKKQEQDLQRLRQEKRIFGV